MFTWRREGGGEREEREEVREREGERGEREEEKEREGKLRRGRKEKGGGKKERGLQYET